MIISYTSTTIKYLRKNLKDLEMLTKSGEPNLKREIWSTQLLMRLTQGAVVGHKPRSTKSMVILSISNSYMISRQLIDTWIDGQ
jgi:hypothetical protein